MKVVDNTIFVGDALKYVTVFEISDQAKPGILNATPKLLIKSQNSQQLSVTSVLPINISQCLVFDRSRNIYLFERNPFPTNDREKLRFDIVACTRSNEIIIHAIEGNLNI